MPSGPSQGAGDRSFLVEILGAVERYRPVVGGFDIEPDGTSSEGLVSVCHGSAQQLATKTDPAVLCPDHHPPQFHNPARITYAGKNHESHNNVIHRRNQMLLIRIRESPGVRTAGTGQAALLSARSRTIGPARGRGATLRVFKGVHAC